MAALAEDEVCHQWRLACALGDARLTRRLWSTGLVDELTRAQGWRIACADNHPDLAEWIWSHGPLPPQNIQLAWESVCLEDRLYLLRRCRHSHLTPVSEEEETDYRQRRYRLAQWIWSLGVPDGRMEEVLVTAAERGHLEMTQWVWSLRVSDETLAGAWRAAAVQSQVEMTDWLWSVVEIDLQQEDIYLIWKVLVNRRDLVMMRWLISAGIPEEWVMEVRHKSPEAEAMIAQLLAERRTKGASRPAA